MASPATSMGPLAMDWLLVAALLWQHFLTFVGFWVWWQLDGCVYHLASRPPRSPLVYGLSLSGEAPRGQPSCSLSDGSTLLIDIPRSANSAVPIEASVGLFRLTNDFVTFLRTRVRHHCRLPVTLSVQLRSLQYRLVSAAGNPDLITGLLWSQQGGACLPVHCSEPSATQVEEIHLLLVG